MSDILTFESEHGLIHFEVEEMPQSTLTAKGSKPMSKSKTENTATSDTRFEKAMSSLSAYASALQDIIDGLDVTPQKVEVEVGLKLRAEGNLFAIAKAGTDAETRVKLTWEPRKAKTS